MQGNGLLRRGRRSRSGRPSSWRWRAASRSNLTARELELLTALVEREGRIVSREELYRVVWGGPYRKSDRSVDVYVGKLRQKLDDALPGRRLHPHAFRLRLPLRAEPAAAGLHILFHMPATSPQQTPSGR